MDWLKRNKPPTPKYIKLMLPIGSRSVEDVGLKDINKQLEPSTRRNILKTAGAALTTAITAGCTNYPEGKETLPPEGPGTQTGNRTEEAPTPEDQGTATEGSGNSTEVEEGGVYTQVADFAPAEIWDSSRSLYASQPSKIADLDLSDNKESILSENYWGINDVLSALNLENADLFILPGKNHFVTIGNRENLTEYGFEDQASYGEFEIWNPETSNGYPEMIATKDDIQINSTRRNQKDALEDLKTIIDTYNGETNSIIDRKPGYETSLRQMNEDADFVAPAPSKGFEAYVNPNKPLESALKVTEFQLSNGQRGSETSENMSLGQVSDFTTY
jgi:hypothetical protein